jgi:WD40 repeat protein
LLSSHSGNVVALVTLPNGDLASSSTDSLIKIWNITSPTCTVNLTEHTNSVNSLVLLKNYDLASGSSDNTVKIWNISNWIVKKTFNAGSIVWSLVELQNGNLAIGCNDGSIIIWDINNNTTLNISGQTSPVTSLVVLLNGYLISGNADGSIKVFDTTSQQFKYDLVNHTSRVNSMVVLPNGYLASASNDGKIKVQNVTEKLLITFTEHNLPVTSLIALSNGDLIEGSHAHNAILYSMNQMPSWINKVTFPVDSPHLVLSLAILKNGQLACGLDDGTIQIFT